MPEAKKDNRWAMLCKLKVEAFNDADWLWEQKLDGDRMRVDVGPECIRLVSRSGNDKTAQFPDLVRALYVPRIMEHAPMVLDGEVVSATGLSFQEFNQRRMNRTDDIAAMAKELPAKFVAFDILQDAGEDLRQLPLLERRKRLDWLFQDGWKPAPVIPELELSAQYFYGTMLFEKAQKEGWEGVVGKDVNEAYLPHRRNWLKVKRWLEGGFECTGYTKGTGKRKDLFGALVVRSDDCKLNAEVGTGFNDAELAELLAFMRDRLVDAGPKVQHVLPFKVRLKYVEVTNAGSLRFPVYLGRI
jgi:bifunctional non-homologous end joining protein LigD